MEHTAKNVQQTGRENNRLEDELSRQRNFRLFDLLYRQNQIHPLERSMGGKQGSEWVFYSTRQLIEEVERTAAGLLKLGLRAGDKMAIVSYRNRPEWSILDLASQMAGIINVPLYPTLSSREYSYILNDAGVSCAFAGSGDLYTKLLAARSEAPILQRVFTMDEQEGRPFWREIQTDDGRKEMQKLRENIQPDDLATIIYTSGTTGRPKGVMLSHRNIIWVVIATQRILPIESGMPVLSFLPLCHIFERAVAYGYLYRCQSIYYTGTDNLGGEEGDLQQVRPVFFTTVPRLLEKIYEAIYRKGQTLKGAQRRIFFWALRLTDDYEYGKRYYGWAALQRKLADRLVFRKWRQAMGGRVKGVISGAAPCPVKLLRTFSAAGIPVREGYGLTETSPTLTVNRFEGGARLGTVGPAISEVELQIDDSKGVYNRGEGEILARGPNVMQGYYNRPDANAEAFKEIDGKQWFRTGDVGKLIKAAGGETFLQITDRKKELLKTSGGKYVAPAPIENRLREHPLIDQAMVVGEGRRFVSALIVPNESALKDWRLQHNMEWRSLTDAIRSESIHQHYADIIEACNRDFSNPEQVKAFTLIPDAWEPIKEDVSEAELTPTMKLKRRVILRKYRKEIEKMYA